MKNLINLITQDQQQQLLSLLIDGPDFVSLSSLNGEVSYVNEAGRKMLGIDSIEEARRHNSEYILDKEQEKLKAQVNKALLEQGRWTGSIIYRHFKTGEPVPVHATTMVIMDSQTNQPAGRATIARDMRPELKAREVQEKLFTLVNSSKDMMTLLKNDGTNDYINAAGRTILGIDADTDVTVIPIAEFHTAEQLAFVEKEILPAVNTVGRWSGRFAVRNRATGEIVPLENDCIRIDDPHTGETVAVGAVMRDLRPELAAQEALSKSEKRFREMIMQAPIAIGLLEGPAFTIATANSFMLDIWGKEENVIGLALLEALPEIKDQLFIELLQQVAATGRPYYGYETLTRLFRKGRMETAYFNFVYARLNEEAGQNSIVVIATDVTAQVIAKREMEENEKRFRSLILEAPMATALYTGPDLIVEVANEAMVKLWGKDASVIGKPLAEAVPELEGQPFIPLLQKVFTSGTSYHADQEKADLLIDGKLQSFWFNYTYKPLHDAEGNVYAIMNMAVDVTKQVQLQHQKDEFIGIASHELKTPVTSIKGYTQVLEAILTEKGLARESGMLNRMNQQINKLTHLIGDLLDVTKIQSGKLLFNDRKFDFNQLVSEVVEDMQHTSSTHTIVKEFEEVGEVYADPERISQVLANLLSNAIKYSPQGDKIIVITKVDGEKVDVCVRDFGVGIPADKHEKVFEQFYRVSGDTQHTFPGLGLGLYIASEIIKREGGRIWVEETVGKGATFCFTLPRNRNK